jgi:hypothetical protein
MVLSTSQKIRGSLVLRTSQKIRRGLDRDLSCGLGLLG